MVIKRHTRQSQEDDHRLIDLVVTRACSYYVACSGDDHLRPPASTQVYGLYSTAAMHHLGCHTTNIGLYLVALKIRTFQAMSFHPNVQFLNTFAALPATTPANHAHIVDVGKTGQSPAMLQDAVVPMLYNISPETLTAFLKPDITSFILLQKRKDPKLSDKFITMKKGCKVLVSASV